jgi:signal recognition particle subunit SEC65
LSDPSKQGVGRRVSIGTYPSTTGPVGINVLKFNGTVQPFDRNKLVNSISKAGATPQQATLVSERVVARLAPKQTVPSNQLSSMVARSLSKVNPTASGQYTSFRDQKKISIIAPATKGTAVIKRPSVLQPATLKPATTPIIMKTTATLHPSPTSKPTTPAAVTPITAAATLSTFRARAIWPTYFDSAKFRRKGRRVPKNLSVKSPRTALIIEAVKQLGLRYTVPGPQTGMILVEKKWSKAQTLRMIANKIPRSRGVLPTSLTKPTQGIPPRPLPEPLRRTKNQ